MDSKHWILWDGECGFCRRASEWVRQKDRRGVFRVTPYQEAPTPPMTPDLAAACERAVHVIKADGTVLRAGRASLFILEQIGWGGLARVLTYPPFIWMVEAIYRIVAKNRPFFSNLFFRGKSAA